MNLPLENIVIGLIVAAVSLFISKFVEKCWEKFTILFVGVFVAFVIIFSPAIFFLERNFKAPSDVDILGYLYGEDADIQENPYGESVFVVQELSGVEKEQFNYASQVNTQVVSKIGGWDQDPQKMLILTRTGPPACCDQSQGPILGGAVFFWVKGTWQVECYQKLITPFGSFDGLETAEIKTIGPMKTAVVLEDKLLRNGILRTWELLLSDLEGCLKVIGKLETGADNTVKCSEGGNDEPCWAYSSVYVFVPGENPKYEDILLTTSGTRILEGNLVSFEETITQKLIL